MPSSSIPAERLGGEGVGLLELLAESGVASSKGDARRSVEGGGIYLNNERATDIDQRVTINDTIEGRFAVLRKGKKNYHLVKINRGPE